MMEYIASQGKVKVNPKTLLITCLRKIYSDDTSDTKDQANRYLTYVHLVSQIDDEAPYFRASHLEVRSLVKKQLFGKSEFEFPVALNEFLEYCILEYLSAYEDYIARAVRVYRQKIDEMITEVSSKKPEIVRTAGIKGQVIFVSNVDLIKKAMASLPELMQIAEELEAKLKKMDKGDSVIRGGRSESLVKKRLARKRNEQKTETKGDDAFGKTMEDSQAEEISLSEAAEEI